LTVTLEVVRFIQALFINWDLDMYHPETDTFATARTSNLNEELGQVRYIFSDKTGTLTRNIMEFRGCSVSGAIYHPDDLIYGQNELLINLEKGGDSARDIRHFLILLSVCHTIIPEYPSEDDGGGETIYHASSPDEIALVSGARSLGYAFEKRTPTWVEIKALGRTDRYELLNTLEFTSTRKRMSVVVRSPNGNIKVYCKGADSVIFERLKRDRATEVMRRRTDTHLHQFSTSGLRTLCCAMREISEEEYNEWQVIYKKASTELHEREKRVEEAAELIEKDLHLLGATAIEDKLQEKVPETIDALLKAGISIWVLTGDKQETAINIGYSCRLLNPTMELLTINKDSKDETWDCIVEYISKSDATATRSKQHMAVVIDGATLKYALHPDVSEDFLALCCRCKAVIVCRASPMQKAEIVELVTEQTGDITLAIGDGANDVAMIQKAHVGIGISGQEGLQAALASDYAIAQFRFLTKLLFVHGAWNYDRMTKLIFYSFYKNICLYIIELWFAIYSGWSGQIIFERWTIGFYNMFFTCAQPIAIGVCERHYSAETRLKYPILYKLNQDSFNLKSFFLWIANSLMHSICLFWLSFFLYGSGVVWSHGKEGGYLVLGNFIYTYVVVVVSLKSGLETRTWTFFSHVSIWGSILLWFVFLILYSYAYVYFPVGQEMLGIAGLVFSSPVFWVGLVVVPTATLLPDFVWKAMEVPEFETLNVKMRSFDEEKGKLRKQRRSHKKGSEDLHNLGVLQAIDRVRNFFAAKEIGNNKQQAGAMTEADMRNSSGDTFNPEDLLNLQVNEDQDEQDDESSLGREENLNQMGTALVVRSIHVRKEEVLYLDGLDEIEIG
ncbi:Phospholipid-transporting ATPase IA, partial [Orchesella cincta]